MRKCEKCGSTLVPGENWYTLKTDHIFCNCNGWPSYFAPTKQGIVSGDYEDAILARQEVLF